MESLKAERAAWLKERPYRTWTEPNADGTRKLFFVEVLDQPPPHLSLIIGDCLHNLRAALDNLAFELAIAHKGEPLSSTIAGNSEFPIFASENLKKFDEMLGGVHPSAKAEIEGLQPYNRGHKFRNDPLWKLNKLSILDKHRLPHVVLFALASISYFVPDSIGIEEIEPINFTVEDRAPIAQYPAFDSTGAEVEVQFTSAFDIAFSLSSPKQLRGVKVAETLTRIHDHITGKVVPALTPYLT